MSILQQSPTAEDQDAQWGEVFKMRRVLDPPRLSREGRRQLWLHDLPARLRYAVAAGVIDLWLVALVVTTVGVVAWVLALMPRVVPA